jgi:NAD(P)-dependent dehydrogenase (short-subunit alcohol dehydrogenase family)
MQKSVRSVLITGTTSGVGRALLDHFVGSGAKVISVNRRRVEELESSYPSVRFEIVDVRSAQAVDALVTGLAASGQLPEVFILNAGINRLDNDESFELSPFTEVFETNLFGVLSFVAPLTRLSAGEGCRHVVAISSMASYAGNPYALGYQASKKALTACFEVWAKMYGGTDLVFQRVMLGPVRTGIFTMAERLPSWLAWVRDACSASVEDSARNIARFAQTRKERIIYPLRAFPLFLALWMGQRLLPGLLGFFQGRKTLDRRVRRTGSR